MSTVEAHEDSQPIVEEVQLLLPGHREECKVVLETLAFVVTKPVGLVLPAKITLQQPARTEESTLSQPSQ